MSTFVAALGTLVAFPLAVVFIVVKLAWAMADSIMEIVAEGVR